jgi:hypothetical protein
MSTQTLSSVASHVVGQYSQVGKLIVGTYRAGAQRLVSGANERYAEFLYSRSLPLMNEAVKDSLIDVQQQFAGLVEGGITNGSNRAEQAIDLLASGVNSGIKRIAATAERVETAFDTNAITTVGSLTMPVAQVSLEIANRTVEGTKRLSARVIGAEAEVAATAKPAAKKAVRRTKARG